MKIKGNSLNLQSCCFSKKTATLLLTTSVAVIAYGILAMIGSLHPSYALGLLGTIGIGGSSGVLGAGILLGGVSSAIICRRTKNPPKISHLPPASTTPSPSTLIPIAVSNQSPEERVEQLLKELDSSANSKIDKRKIWFPRLNRVLKEDLPILKHLLKTHAYFQANADPFSIIYLAIELGENEFISLLLENGLNPNFLLGGKPLLMHAILFKQIIVVQTLLDYHADAVMEDKDGKTLLHRAASEGWDWEIELLITHYAGKGEIDRQDKEGYTALTYASYKGHTTFAQLLLANGSNISLNDKNDRDAFYQAVYSGNRELVNLMLAQNPNINKQDKEGLTPLLTAVNKGHTEIVQLLLQRGSDPLIEDHIHRSSLHHAALSGREPVVRLMLQSSVQVDAQDKEGLTPLLMAIHLGHTEIVQLLLQNGSDPLIEDHIHRSSLHHAALSGKEAVVQVILNTGAKKDAIDAYGNTPSMLARGVGHEKLAQTLEIGLDDNHRALVDHKLLSHRFDWDIQVEFQGKKVNLSFIAPWYCYTDLYNTFPATREWLKQAPSVWKEKDTDALLESLKFACNTINKKDEEAYILSVLKAYNDGKVVIVPTGSIQHSNVIILYKDYLIKGDRTLSVTNETYSKYIPGLFIYKIESKDKLKDALTSLMSEKKSSQYTDFFRGGIDALLGLRPIKYCKRGLQKANVCSWNSGVKPSVEGFFIAQLLKLGMTLDDACAYGNSMYKAWVKEDLIKALENYLVKVHENDMKTTVLACIYKHHVNKANRKKMSSHPILSLIEKYHPANVTLSQYVKFQNNKGRKAFIELPSN